MTTTPPAPPGDFAGRVNANITEQLERRSYRLEFIAQSLGVTPRALFEKRRRATWRLADLEKLAAVLEIDPSVLTAPRS